MSERNSGTDHDGELQISARPKEKISKFVERNVGGHDWKYSNHPFIAGDESDHTLHDKEDDDGFPSREIILRSADQIEEDLSNIDEGDYYLHKDIRESVVKSSEKYFFDFVTKYIPIESGENYYLQGSVPSNPVSFSDLGIKVNIVPYGIFVSINEDGDEEHANTNQDFTYSDSSDGGSTGVGILDTSHRRHIFIRETPVNMQDPHIRDAIKEFNQDEIQDAVVQYTRIGTVHEALHKVVFPDYEDKYIEEGFVELCTLLALPSLTPNQKGLLKLLNESDETYVENTNGVADLFIALVESGQFTQAEIFKYFYKHKDPNSKLIDDFLIQACKREDADQIANRRITAEGTLSRMAHDIVLKKDIHLDTPLDEMSLDEKVEFIKTKYLREPANLDSE